MTKKPNKAKSKAKPSQSKPKPLNLPTKPSKPVAESLAVLPDGFAPEMVVVASSNLAAIGWKDNTLAVQFKNGNTFAYHDVPHETFNALYQAESVGGYFAQNIKDKFRAEVFTPGGTVKLTKDGDIEKGKADDKQSSGSVGPDATVADMAVSGEENSTDPEQPEAESSEASTGSGTVGPGLGADAVDQSAESDAATTPDEIADTAEKKDEPSVRFSMKSDAAQTQEPIAEQSENLEQLRYQLEKYGIGLTFERSVDKREVDHWNLVATVGDEETSRSVSYRIDENATDEECLAAHNAIIAAFIQTPKPKTE